MNTREELLAELAEFGISRWVALGDAEHPHETLAHAYRRWKRSKHGLPFFAWAAWAPDFVKDCAGYGRGQCMRDWMGSSEPEVVALWRRKRDGVCIWQGNCGPQWEIQRYGFKHEPGQGWRSGQIFFLHPDKGLVLDFMRDCWDLSISCEEIERKYTALSDYKRQA